ncbi:protoheme IX farnesyltransferase, mitochondrial isoform X2 [Teleopsis dalmanni]|nr:protoheme IX farnesyltransferase, mitochondrial isoform X2 [Teleopsis dalmanni]
MSTLSDSQHKYDPLTNNAPTAIKEVRLPLTETSQSKKSTEEDTICVQTPNNDLRSLISHYKGLSKFRLTSLVVLTAVGGYAMAPMPFDITSFLLCTLGTGLLSAGANSINQYHEVPFDAQMARTKHRVLVTGKVTRLHAVGFAITCASMGLSMLYFGVNGLTAALGLSNFILYTSIYTPMKRTSILNTWVGSVVGAIPPLMGWAACTGTLDSGAWILAGLLYAWQFPHFNALSWNLRPDYKRAGYRMMAVSHPGLCRRTALRYTFVIAGLSMVAPLCDLTNNWFALETLPLNIYFIYLAYKFYQKSDSGTSRKLFRFSLVHLPALMLLLLFNKKEWFISKESKLSSTDDTTQIDKVAIPESFKLAEKKDTLLQVLVPPNRQHIVPAAITTNSET